MKNRGILMLVVCVISPALFGQTKEGKAELKKISLLVKAKKEIVVPIEKPDDYSVVKERKIAKAKEVKFDKPLRDPKKQKFIARERLRK